MKLEYKKLVKALNAIEEDRNIPEEVVIEALKEAMAKAYKKAAELSDIDVVAELNQKSHTIDLYQRYTVVEEVEDDELEISLEDAKELDSSAEIGSVISRPVNIEVADMSRAAATLAKNVMRQKIREAEKVAIFEEYVNQLDELVLGTVESVKEKFTLVNLGKTVAMLPKSAQIPGERYREGEQIRVVITEVNKDTKGSQVLVSRADSLLVKRLFEREVPEIFSGDIEIKSIARDAGERTKMAVLSHNPDVDPIGACIGPRGQRVSEVINELHGEKIDIFQWSEDVTELVKNALAPAEIIAVVPSNDKSLLVIVDENQLSLAIGKRGKNARLAVKLTNHKIDIKTRAELEEMGMDYDELMAKAEEYRASFNTNKSVNEDADKVAREAEERRIAAADKLAAAKAAEAELMENEDIIPDEMMDTVSDQIQTEMAVDVVEEAEQLAQEENEVVSEEVVEEKVEDDEEDMNKASKHANLEEMAAKNTYVSAFEKLADTSKPKQDKPKKKKKKSEEGDYKVKNKDLEKQIKAELVNKAAAPIYTEEELAEIEEMQEREEESQYDIDYDEYEDYYNDEDNH